MFHKKQQKFQKKFICDIFHRNIFRYKLSVEIFPDKSLFFRTVLDFLHPLRGNCSPAETLLPTFSDFSFPFTFSFLENGVFFAS
jgi:hypothetical protein